MIILTSPPSVKSVLGGSGTVNYDKFVLISIHYEPIDQTVTATVRLTSSANPDMQAITGRLNINRATGKLEIQVDQLDFYRRVSLTGPQSTAIENQIRGAQDALEAGLISLSLVAGVQSTGT